MLIKILYKNNTYDMIKSTRLGDFIATGNIAKFCRSTGWVTIGVDPTRKINHGYGEERRESTT